jgi:hypothetical protein
LRIDLAPCSEDEAKDQHVTAQELLARQGALEEAQAARRARREQ